MIIKNRHSTRMIAFVAIVLFAYCLCVAISGRHHAGYDLEEDEFVHDKTAFNIRFELYEKTGRIIHSLSDFEQSAYYPFTTSMSPTMHGGTLVAGVKRKGNQNLTGYVKIQKLPNDLQKLLHYTTEPEWPVNFSPVKLTVLRLTSYVQGVDSRLKLIHSVQDDFLRNFRKPLRIGDFHPPAKKPPLSRPLNSDFPHNKQDLKRYLDWVRKTDNLPSLVDGWGRPLKFYIQRGKIVGCSAGADGFWKSNDDVTVS